MTKVIATSIALGLILAAAPWLAADKLRLGVAPFEVAGTIDPEAGKELAGFVVGILGDRYMIKERLQLPTLLKETVGQSDEIGQTAGDFRRDLQIDLLLLGRVTKTAGDYTLLVRLCDLRGTLSFRDTITASSWEALKEKLRLSLIRHHLAPLHGAASKIPVTFVFIDNHGQRHPGRLYLKGDNQRYRVDGTTEVPPGRYHLQPLDRRWQPQTTWIEIKPGAKAETIEIRVKAHGIDIYLVFGYGGVGAGLLGILLFILRRRRQQELQRLAAGSARQAVPVEDLVALAGRGQRECKALAGEISEYRERLTALAARLGVVADKIEMMPEARLQERRYHLDQVLGKIVNELALFKGLASGGNLATATEQLASIEHKVEGLL